MYSVTFHHLGVNVEHKDTNDHLHTHLKGVLGHAGEAVVGGASGDGADTELADLIGLTELRDAFWFHHTRQA